MSMIDGFYGVKFLGEGGKSKRLITQVKAEVEVSTFPVCL
jgi:hypothetical protein